jgi:hypothetical protein
MKVNVVSDAAGEIQTIMGQAPPARRKGPVGRYILQPGEQLHEVEVPAQFAKYSLLELHMSTRLDLKGAAPRLIKAVKA